MIAKEIESISRLQSSPIQVILNVINFNNNKPIFSQDAYQITLKENIMNSMFDIEILQFNVTSKYMSTNNLYCYLRGIGAEK